MRFIDRLRAAQLQNQSRLIVGLDPSLQNMPLEFQRYDDPFLPFGKAVIDATRDLTCAYAFNLASYLALGAAGAIALERTIAYVPDPLIKILHGQFASIDYISAAYDNALNADAVTLTLAPSAYTVIEFYAEVESHGMFVDTPQNIADDRLLRLATHFPGQIGVYHRVADEYCIAAMLPDNDPVLHWHDALNLYSGQDYKTALHDSMMRMKLMRANG